MKVSVIVPGYDAAQYLEKCLTSIKNALPPGGELIFVDDASKDESVRIAERYADRVEVFEQNRGMSSARNSGYHLAQGDILVFVDSDVVIPGDTLSKISDYFETHPEVDAVTGLLSKEHPHTNFFSQYKNLYMHYVFMNTPEHVSFLYGSIHAVRKEAMLEYDPDIPVANDTALGQKMLNRGKTMILMKDLQVLHLKKFTLLSLMRNDFSIPYTWARIFIRYGGWKQLGRGGTGYAHASKRQLASVLLTPLLLGMGVVCALRPEGLPFAFCLVVLWAVINGPFLKFLSKERGITFGILAGAWTLWDQLVMAFGITCGFLSCLFRGFQKEIRFLRLRRAAV